MRATNNGMYHFAQAIRPVSTWYVLANRTEAAFYEEERAHEFHFIERLTNRKGHLTEAELDSDKPGRGSSSAGGGTIRHSLDRRFSRHEQVARRFARKVAKILGAASVAGRFDSLVIVAEPHFLGLLRAALPKAVSDRVRHEIPREFLQGSTVDLKKKISESIAS